MAGVMTEGDEGVEVQKQSVAAMGGAEYRSSEGLSPTVEIVQSEHVGDAMRAEGVNYNTDESIGTDLNTAGYPAGTEMTDSTPSDDAN